MTFFDGQCRSIVVVRHGETDWNSARKIQGRTEVPLNETGAAQASQAASLLREAGAWTRVITSPLGRAQQTARIIADELDLDAPTVDLGVIERDFGSAEGVSVSDAQAQWPGLEIPDAEPLDELSNRGAAALMRILHSEPGSIVVAHGALMRSALSALAGDEMPRIANGELWLVEQTDADADADRVTVRCIATPALAALR